MKIKKFNEEVDPSVYALPAELKNKTYTYDNLIMCALNFCEYLQEQNNTLDTYNKLLYKHKFDIFNKFMLANK